jgi:DivIVA domain-containing protein
VTEVLLVVAVALTVGAIVFGITLLVTGDDDGLRQVEPDGRAVPLPGERPLAESDLAQLRFDTALRGYRMAQVDAALRRAAYDIGYKEELVRVLQAEVDALREGRFPDAEVLRRAREAALPPADQDAPPAEPVQDVELVEDVEPADPVEDAAPAEAGAPETGAPEAPEAEPGETGLATAPAPQGDTEETDPTTLPSRR